MRDIRAAVFEALVVAAAGLVFAIAANALSPRGLRLTRNYFPGENQPGLHAATTPGNSADPTLERLRRQNLHPVGSNDVIELFRDPRYQQGLVVFIDARNDDEFQAGHIPGARQFNHYRADATLPGVLPLCLAAQKVVVYCNGGECEDSEFAAIILRDAGVPGDNLFVYAGGIAEWMTNGLPVETGGDRPEAQR
jgi:rhodanese-related sulfurtransferase